MKHNEKLLFVLYIFSISTDFSIFCAVYFLCYYNFCSFAIAIPICIGLSIAKCLPPPLPPSSFWLLLHGTHFATKIKLENNNTAEFVRQLVMANFSLMYILFIFLCERGLLLVKRCYCRCYITAIGVSSFGFFPLSCAAALFLSVIHTITNIRITATGSSTTLLV